MPEAQPNTSAFAGVAPWPLVDEGRGSQRVTTSRFQRIGRLIIGTLLVAEGVTDIGYSMYGPHVNLFWIPLLHQSVVPGLMWITLGVGFWRAWGWARVSCGLLSVLSWAWWAIAEAIIGPFISPVSQGIRGVIWSLVFACPSAALAIYCFMPAIRTHFAQAREIRARIPAVPR